MGNNHTKDTIASSFAQAKSIQSQSLPTKPPKLKPFIIHKAKWRCLTSTDLTYINKYKPKMLSMVHLTHIDYENIKARGLKTLCKSLKDTKSVSSLIIDPKDLNFKQLQFPYLLRATNRWKKLEFHFHRTGFDKNSEIIKNLKGIRKCRDLSSLVIYINHGVPKRVIDSLSQQVKGLPKLQNISFSSPQTSRILGDMDYIPIFNFKYPRSLSSITLNLANVGLIYQQLLDKFISNVQLEDLRLDFFMPTEIEPQFWERFFQKIQQIKSLKLRKNFSGSCQLLENQAFFQGLSQLKNLTSLDFSLFDSSGGHQVQISTNLLRLLFDHLASCPNLKSLNLSFTVRVTDQDELQDSFPSIQHLTQLEELQLNLVFHVETKTTFLQKFIQSLQYLCSLKKLKLNLQQFEISHELVITLANSLQKLSHLKILDLHFHNFRLDYSSMEILATSITNLNLTVLFMDLGKSSFKSFLQQTLSIWNETHRLTGFFSALYGFSLLSTLRLDLSAFDISIPEYKHFSLALKELRQLQTLRLILPAFDSSNNFETLQSLMSSLTTIPKLTDLWIEFLGRLLGSNGLSHIASNLGKCKSLETLELHFLFAERFDKKSIQFLFCEIARLASLKSLNISFGKLEFEAFEVFQLLKELTTLRNLEILEAYFPGNSSRIFQYEPDSRLASLRDHQNFRHLVKFKTQ